jgi:hypothetical protein
MGIWGGYWDFGSMADFVDLTISGSSRLPLDHPALLNRPTERELKEELRRCTWMRIECNAWRWHFGPCCGLDSMDKLNRCKRRI